MREYSRVCRCAERCQPSRRRTTGAQHEVERLRSRATSATAPARGLWVVAAWLVLLCGCGRVDWVADRLPDAAGPRDAAEPLDAAQTDGSSPPLDGAKPDAEQPLPDAAEPDGKTPAPEPCDYLTQHDGASPSLSEWLASRYQHAVCTCAGLVPGGTLTVRSTSDGPGHVGSNGAAQLRGRVDGDLSTSDAMGLRLSPGEELLVGGGLSISGPLLGAGAVVDVGGNAQVGDRIELSRLTVGGRLSLPMDAALAVDTLDTGELRRAEPDITAPCGCGSEDVDTLRALAAELARATDPLPSGTPLSSECGRYASRDPSGEALSVDVETDSLWVITGDLAAPSLEVRVAPDATLDMLVSGNLVVEGLLRLGSPDGGRVRLLIAGPGTAQLSGGAEIDGWLDAPAAEVVAEQGLTVRGAVFARRLAGAAAVTVEHHR